MGAPVHNEGFPRYTPLGGAREIGASCGVLEIGAHRLLIDAGLRMSGARAVASIPGGSGESRSSIRTHDPRLPDLGALGRFGAIEAVFITHAHYDHAAGLPIVARLLGPTVPIFCTPESAALIEVNLLDQVAFWQRGEHTDTPLYTEDDVRDTLARLRPLIAGVPISLDVGSSTLGVLPVPAGHILGAVMLAFETAAMQGGTWRALMTGDFAVHDQFTVPGASLELLEGFAPHLLVSEGTYGASDHRDLTAERMRLVRQVLTVAARGGCTLIPAFAIGRAQEVALLLADYQEHPDRYAEAWREFGSPPVLQVYLDGAARRVADIYDNYAPEAPSGRSQEIAHRFFRPSRAHSMQRHERWAFVEPQRGRVMISPSGMLNGGPAETYARQIAKDARHAILFSGYLDEESGGAKLLSLAELPAGERRITLGDESVAVHCEVASYSLSAHTDAVGVERLVQICAPAVVALVHGPLTRLQRLKERIGALYSTLAMDGPTVHIAGPGNPTVVAPVGPVGGPSAILSRVSAAPEVSSLLTTTDIPRIIHPEALVDALIGSQARGLTPREITARAFGTAAAGDPFFSRLVAEELEGAVGRLFDERFTSFGVVYSLLSAGDLPDGHSGVLAHSFSTRVWQPVDIIAGARGDLVLVKYLDRHVRSAVLLTDIEPRGMAALVSFAGARTVFPEDILLNLGHWRDSLADSDGTLDDLNGLSWDPDLHQPVVAEPSHARDLLFSWLFSDDAIPGRLRWTLGRMLARTPGLVWEGPAERAAEMYGVPLNDPEFQTWEREIRRMGVLVEAWRSERRYDFAPAARRLVWKDEEMGVRIRYETRAWRRVLDGWTEDVVRERQRRSKRWLAQQGARGADPPVPSAEQVDERPVARVVNGGPDVGPPARRRRRGQS